METRDNGQVRYWALIVSIAVHSAALGIFTGVKLHSRHLDTPSDSAVVDMKLIAQVVQQPSQVRPKPRVEPIAKLPPEPAPEQPEQVPLIAEPKPPEPVIVETVTPMDTPEVQQPAYQPPPVANEVEFFGNESVADSVCFVVDCSGSMYGQMYEVREQLKKSILNLNSDQSFAIVFFMNGQEILTNHLGMLVQATASAKSRALKLTESIRPAGTTDAVHALKCAMRMKDAKGRGPQLVYFLTDGFDLDEDSSTAFVQSICQLRRQFAPGTVLHTIGFWPQPQDCRTLALLAGKTGGEFINVNQ